ncbi:hypothetical protein M407DRAFT_206096 [Tulasnella calospora MUT 4182]|uniref:Uncharacterized protein n=1 Tax=Tulasnella calospora MUT 4182 TaxID=1051891 RepID=A0A0C3KWV0_9AGAM|nr:hypothetical protein M407DRAFT_206096 [Tulasnella calospora MUT 4182]
MARPHGFPKRAPINNTRLSIQYSIGVARHCKGGLCTCNAGTEPGVAGRRLQLIVLHQGSRATVEARDSSALFGS